MIYELELFEDFLADRNFVSEEYVDWSELEPDMLVNIRAGQATWADIDPNCAGDEVFLEFGYLYLHGREERRPTIHNEVFIVPLEWAITFVSRVLGFNTMSLDDDGTQHWSKV